VKKVWNAGGVKAFCWCGVVVQGGMCVLQPPLAVLVACTSCCLLCLVVRPWECCFADGGSRCGGSWVVQAAAAGGVLLCSGHTLDHGMCMKLRAWRFAHGRSRASKPQGAVVGAAGRESWGVQLLQPAACVQLPAAPPCSLHLPAAGRVPWHSCCSKVCHCQ
jgi:hypothetical protein